MKTYFCFAIFTLFTYSYSNAAPIPAIEFLGADATATLKINGGEQTDLTLPLYSYLEADSSFVETDALAGTIKGVAVTTPIPEGGFLATSAAIATGTVQLEFRNLLPIPILLPAGSISVTSDADFQRNFPTGYGASGFFSRFTFLNSLGGLFTASATAAVNYSYDASKPDQPVTSTTLIGGWGLTYTYDDLSARVTFASPEWVVGVGETFFILATTGATATVISIPPDPLAQSFTDFSRTTRLAWQLPDDIGLVSPFPLGWVSASPVPEVGSFALIASGLLLVVLTTSLRKQQRPTSR